jgi:threonine/homoserine/homoserine lactone efflux protein
MDFWQNVAALIVAATIIMGSPGPSNLSAAAVGAAFGIHGAAKYVVGLATGTTAVLLLVSFGLIAVITAIPTAMTVLKVASALYLIYLAYQIGTAPPLKEDVEAADAPAFFGGFLLGIANPKAYFAIAAVVAGATILPEDLQMDGVVKVGILILMIALIHLVWLCLGVGLAKFLRDPVISRIANIAMAVALLVTGALALVG